MLWLLRCYAIDHESLRLMKLYWWLDRVLHPDPFW
jgi:hypothetical protein